MDVRIYDIDKSITSKEEEMEFIGSFPKFVMNQDLEFGGFIEINGDVYRMCFYTPSKNILSVERSKSFESEPTTIEADEFTCPFCKEASYDWELLDDEGAHSCGSCNSDSKYKRIRLNDDLDYRYMIDPLKISGYTKLS